MKMLYIQTPRERPDYRLVIAFLWGDARNVDSDGNSHNPASRTWTELMLDPRDTQGDRFDVHAHQEAPLILEVRAEKAELAARVAYFLALSTDGMIAHHPDGPYLPPSALVRQAGNDFDIDAALQRVQNSPFTRSTLENPYPNLHWE